MKEVTFYYINNEDLLQTAVSMVAGLYKNNTRSVIFCEDIDFLQKLDTKLWTFSSEMFIPHIIKGEVEDLTSQSFVLINKIESCIDFSTICEILDSDDFAKIKEYLSTTANCKYTKIYFIFSGIDSVERYASEIKSIEIDASKRFFVKTKDKWEQFDV